MALTLCREANVPTERPLGITEIIAFENLLDVNVLVLSAKLGNKFCRVANEPGRRNIYLYLTESEKGKGHFDGIGSINGFFNYGYFCETCLKPYKNKGKHSCTTTCNVCGSNNCVAGNDPMSCRFCNRSCRSLTCYQRHKAKVDKRGKDVELSMCERVYQCKFCRKVIERSKRKPEEHACGEYKCKNCFEYQMGQHLCYQRKPSRKLKSVPRKFFFYDFESTQNKRMFCESGYMPAEPCKNECTLESRCNKCRFCIPCRKSWCGLEEHKVNFAVLQSTCDKCMDEELTERSKCQWCGSRCDKCRAFRKNRVVLPCKESCGYRQRVFSGNDVPTKFCSHIMTRYYRNNALIAHNAKGFDNYPILHALIDHHAVRPTNILFQGSKIVYMYIAGMDLSFLDSANFMAMTLSKLPKCFDLEELKKGYFPHLFNTSENRNYVGIHPDPKYYGVEDMSSEERDIFLEWYQSQKDHNFDLQKELHDYCVADVDILRRCSMKFRQIMMEATSTETLNAKGEVTKKTPGIDPFDYVTIASACQAIYRELFLEEEYETYVTDVQTKERSKRPTKFEQEVKRIQLPTGECAAVDTVDSSRYHIGKTVFVKSPIALVPSEGYNTDTFSKASIEWLEWTMEKARRRGRRLEIKHALNGGEHTVQGTRYKLEGFDAETKTAYEFHGESHLITLSTRSPLFS